MKSSRLKIRKGSIMCLILLAYKKHPRFKLIIAANRDEFFNRPTQSMQWWDDPPFLLAGKDLKEGGTWLGITQHGKFAAITNFRDSSQNKEKAPSRGLLVKDFLSSQVTAENFLDDLSTKSSYYNGFNLIFGDIDQLYFYSNKSPEILKLKPGFYGLSNHLLNTPWPKVIKGKKRLKEIILKNPDFDLNKIFTFLKDNTIAPDHQLPETGIKKEWERILSPIFIKSENYGTRSSTVILVERNNNVVVLEQNYIPSAKNHFNFRIH